MLPKGDAFDLFSGGRRTLKKEIEEKIPRKQAGLIRFSSESHPETTIFSPDGQSLVTGSVDGFIELWDCDTCKLRKDLDYQMKDELMMHEEAVLCSSFSRDAEYLATGSQGGKLKVWKVSTGVCVRRFNQAHVQVQCSILVSVVVSCTCECVDAWCACVSCPWIELSCLHAVCCVLCVIIVTIVLFFLCS